MCTGLVVLHKGLLFGGRWSDTFRFTGPQSLSVFCICNCSLSLNLSLFLWETEKYSNWISRV